MARIAGVDLPKQKKAFVGLTYIYGIGRTTAYEILEKAKVDPDKKISELNDEEVAQIRSIMTSEYKVEGALRSEVQQNVKRLMEIGSYKGLRHRRGLPVNGQNTQKNSRTRKGRRRTVAGKKKSPMKK